MLEKNEILEKETYQCIDYANEVFEPVKIIENNSITGDIAYLVLSTQESMYFSGQGGFEKLN